MNMTSKACAKTILFGEHAVVYGKAGICVPIKKLYTLATPCDENYAYITDREITEEEHKNLSKLLKFLYEKLNAKISVNIETNIPIASGLGSSASLCVAIIRAFSKYFNFNFDEKKINELAFECEKIFHGNPSGIDNTTIVYEKPIFFKKGKFEFINLKKPLYLVIANSGIKSNTKETVLELKGKYEKEPDKYLDIFNKINEISETAKEALEKGDLKKVGKLMIQNHEILGTLGLSTIEIDAMISKALSNGAYGAKIIGSGKGGNIAVLTDETKKDKISNELMKLSREVFNVVVT